jgi:heme/copper-type cytochrome/quinol oxidase subunit 4
MIKRMRWGLIGLAVLMGVGNGLGTVRRIGILLGLLPPPATPVPFLALWMLPVVVGWIALLLLGAVKLIRRQPSAGWIFTASFVLFALHMVYFLIGEPSRERVVTGGGALMAVYFGIFAILIAGSFFISASTNQSDSRFL